MLSKEIENIVLNIQRNEKGCTRKDVKPDRFKVWKYFLISKIFGITFGIKLMEKGEEKAQETYERYLNTFLTQGML